MRTFIRQFILGSLVAASAMAAATSASRAQYYPWCLVISDKLGVVDLLFRDARPMHGLGRRQCRLLHRRIPPLRVRSRPPPRRHRAHG